MVIAPVDDGDAHGRARECPRAGEAAEASADDHDMGARVGHRGRADPRLGIPQTAVGQPAAAIAFQPPAIG